MPLPPASIELEEIEELAQAELPQTSPAPSVAPPLYQPTNEAPSAAETKLPQEPLQAAEELIAWIRAQVEKTRDQARLGHLYAEWARLLEYPLQNQKEALRLYQKAHELLPQHLPVLQGLRRLHLLRGEIDKALPWLNLEIEHTTSADERVSLLVEKGLLLEGPLKRPGEARLALEQAAAIRPEDPAVLRALLRLHRREQSWKEWDRLSQIQAQQSTEDPELTAARWFERARTSEIKSKDLTRSAEFFQHAFSSAKQATAALSHLERLANQAGRIAELVQILEQRVRFTQSPEIQVILLRRIAQLADVRLGELPLAERALTWALTLEPQNTELLREAIAIAERAQNTERQIQLLRNLLELLSAPDEKLRLHLRLGRLFEEVLQQVEPAAEEYEHARKLDPTHPEVTDTLLRLYRKQELWEPLIAVYTGLAQAPGDSTRRAAAHTQIALIYEQSLKQLPLAIEHLEQALGLTPGFIPAFRHLDRLLAEQGDYPSLLELYERAVQWAHTDATAIAYLLKIARLYEDPLADPERALKTYERVLQRAPQHLEAVLGLQRTAERAQDYESLVRALEREAELVPAPERVPLLHRAGEICELQKNDEKRALLLYQKVLQLEPRYIPALVSLRRLHRQAGRMQDVVDTYQKELSLVTSPEEKAQLLLALGELQEKHLGQRAAAITQYKQALEIHPSQESIRDILLQSLRSGQHWEELARTLKQEAERSAQPETKQALWLQLGQLYETELQQPQEALTAYEAVLQQTPGHRFAREAKLRLLALLERPAELLRALQDEEKNTDDPWARLSAQLRIAALLREELNRPAEAAQKYESVLASHPAHPEALSALEILYTELQRPAERARILEEQVRTARLREDQIAALRELLAASSSAEDQNRHIQALLQRDPLDRLALEAAERLAWHQKQAEAWAQVSTARTQRTAHPELQAVHHTQVGEHLEYQNPQQALTHYREALRLDGSQFSAARGMTRIAERQGGAPLLLEAAEAEIRFTQDSQRAERLLTRAALEQEQSSDLDGAVHSLERALLVHPDSRLAAEALLRLRHRQQKYDELVTILADAAERASSPAVQVEHWIAVARTHAQKREDLPAALAALLRVEKLHPGSTPALLELAEHYVHTGQFEEAAQRLERALPLATPDSLPAVQLRLAQIYHEHLQREAAALQLLHRVLEKEPHNQSALRRKLALQMSLQQGSPLETARAWAEASTGPERAEALTTLGRLERDAHNWVEAQQSWEQAIALSGVSEDGAARDLRQLLAEHSELGTRENYERLAQAIASYLRSAPPSPQLSLSWLELSRVYLDHLQDPERGFPALERSIESAPEHAALRQEYVARLKKAGHLQRALQELRTLLDQEPQRASTWHDLVEVFDGLAKNAEAHLALGPLLLCGGGTELQRATWQARKPRPAWLAEQSLDSDTQNLLGVPLPEATRALLEQLGDLAPKLFPQASDALQDPELERVLPRATHPLRPLFDRVVRAFDVSGIELYVSPRAEAPLRLVLGDPLALIVPSGIVGYSEPEQIFLLARFIAPIARRTQITEALTQQELHDWIIAAVRLVEPQAGQTKTLGHEIEQLSRRLSKALPWLSKGKFEEIVRRFLVQSQGEIPSVAQLARSATATALLVSDDLSPLVLLSRSKGIFLGLSPEETRALSLDLLRVWVSEPAMQFRRQTGLL